MLLKGETMSRKIQCKNCSWFEPETSDSGWRSARYHETLYGHKVILKIEK